ncbi:MAG: seryl-tRNA synthetase [Patescibacteria group bacterium]|nr:seryl-tRNA synthetase [Patescibacteria group bacterium]
MLDIKFIRENKEIIEAGAQKKHMTFDVSKLIEVDDKRMGLLKTVENLRFEQNKASVDLGGTLAPEKRAQILTDMGELKEDLKKLEEDLKEVMHEWQALMLQVPNVPDISVPEGESENDNQEVKTWGEKPEFSFEPKDHIELMTNLKMADFERGTKVHGFRGYFLMGDGARLSMAIWNYALNFFSDKNFNPFVAPSIVNKEYFIGTGHLPGDAEDIFQTQDDQYLAGTAEVPMMAYHSNEILSAEELPKRYLAFSPCYRREAGSHGKDMKGLIRVHEFYKWEQLILCRASHEESVKYHEELNRNIEEFIESFGLPYRQLSICGGDLKNAHVKSYDTELWVPKEGKYREIGSTSYYHDFQTRRFNIRYRDEQGKIHYAHSLNATAIPTPRILVSLVENFQQEDGTIKIPEVLRPYMGGRDVIRRA